MVELSVSSDIDIAPFCWITGATARLNNKVEEKSEQPTATIN
jgi:hypothetical protein